MATADPPVFVQFHPTATSLTVACGPSDLRVYSLQAVENRLSCTYRLPFGEVVAFEHLKGTDLVAAVTASDPNRLLIADCVRNREVDDHLYPSPILALKVNCSHIIVCLKHEIYIHNIASMVLEHVINDMPANIEGVCALTIIDGPNCFLAYPSSKTRGVVRIFDAHRLQDVTSIATHSSPIVALAFSHTGNELAAASKRSSVIRVVSTETFETVHEFRYSRTRAAHIDSLAFSTCGNYLGAVVQSGLIQIFHCVRKEEVDAVPVSRSRFRNCVLARLWHHIFDPKRAFATLNHRTTPIRSVCAIIKPTGNAQDGKSLVLVATADAFLKVFTLSSNEGNNCTELKTFDLNYKDAACVNYSGFLAETAVAYKKKIAEARVRNYAVEI